MFFHFPWLYSFFTHSLSLLAGQKPSKLSYLLKLKPFQNRDRAFNSWSQPEKKDFPKPRQDIVKFAEKFRIVLVVHHPGLPDPHPLVHILVGTSDANNWMKTAEWEDPQGDLRDPELHQKLLFSPRASTISNPRQLHICSPSL